MTLNQSTIQKVVTDYFRTKPVLRVWLFSSFARKEEQADSDVDLLVQVDEAKKVGLEYYLWPMELMEILQRKVDMVSHGYVNKRIAPFIDQDKVLVYQK